MSVRIGMIISKEYNLNLLENLKEKFDLGLFQICNNYVANQLLEDEIFLQTTKTGCDSLTGIGAYDIYNKDSSLIYKSINDPIVAQLIIDEFEYRKLGYKENVIKWIEILSILKTKYKIDKLGLFWHECIGAFDKEKINFSSRVNCKIDDISIDYMMKIEKDVIVFFS